MGEGDDAPRGRRAPAGRPQERELLGIVVGRQDFGEHDRVIRMLGPDGGRFSVFAPAARRAFSPFGALDLGVRAKVVVRVGRGDLLRLSRGEVEEGRAHLRDSMEGMAIAAYACELISGLAQADHPEPRLYGLLEMALLLLDATTRPPGAAFLAGIEAKALSFAGVAPVLDRCARCARPLEAGPVAWLPEAGGTVHRDELGAGELRAVTVDAPLLAELEAARRRPLRESLELALPGGPVRILADLAEHHLARPLQSRSLLALLDAP
jgi:DNA repair protein RecO (recombination protein O)